MVRRACVAAHRSNGARGDNRVSVAVAANTPLAVLLTFHAEIRGELQTKFRQVIAVLLPCDGPAKEIAEPQSWLRLGRCPDSPPDHVWRDQFSSWVPSRQPEAETLAGAVMRRQAERFAEEYRFAVERESLQLQQWLQIRTDDICGSFVPRTIDLFDARVSDADWRSLSAPLDRLQGFAADDSNPLPRRREASDVVHAFSHRSDVRAALPPPHLRSIGMLMLLPASTRGA